MCELHCSQLKTGQYLRVYDPPSEAEEKSWMATHLPCTDLLVRRILSELECTPYHGTCDTKTGAFCCSLFSIFRMCSLCYSARFVFRLLLFGTHCQGSTTFGHYDVGSLLKILEIGHKHVATFAFGHLCTELL